MRGFRRRNMFRLPQAIMIACALRLGRRFAARGFAPLPHVRGASAENTYSRRGSTLGNPVRPGLSPLA
jgi:hypothetical protein